MGGQPQRQKADSSKFSLSPCAAGYAKALTDPCNAPPACIPTFPPLPSQKLKAYIKGTFLLDTTGFGFVAFDPQLALANDTGATTDATTEKSWPVVYSDGNALTNKWISIEGSFTGVDGANSNSPFSTVEFSDSSISDVSDAVGVDARVVGACLRVKYAGDSLSDKGTIFGISHPDNASLNDCGVTQLSAFDGVASNTMRDARGWLSVLWKPTKASDYEYEDKIHRSTAGVISLCAPPLGFIVTGGTAGAPMQFEAYVIFEAIGPLARGKTPSTADPTGFSAVLNYVADLGAGALKSLSWESVSRGITNIASLGYSGYQAYRGNLLPAATQVKRLMN